MLSLWRSRPECDESLGSVDFYKYLYSECDEGGYSGSSVLNSLRIHARDRKSAETKNVNLSELTCDDLICWFHRRLTRFEALEHKNIRHEQNPDFDLRNPCGYQWTRVQITNNGKILEHTRQVLCMFCQEVEFLFLTGPNGLIRHYEQMHPHEVPQFVKMLLVELDLVPELAPKIKDTIHLPKPLDWGMYWKHLEYRKDGVSNKLKFVPRPGMEESEMEMNLSDVTHKHVMCWYERDIDDFKDYPHINVQYHQIPMFDPLQPEVSQISRVLLDRRGKISEVTREHMCMYCREPKFFRVFETFGLLAHIACYHWREEVPSSDLVVKWINHNYQGEEQN